LQFLGYSVSLLALNLHKEYKKNSTQFEAAPAQLLPLSALSSSTTATIGSLGSDRGGVGGVTLVGAQDREVVAAAIDVENDHAPLLQV
jgi:hypothetical protein